VDSNFGSDHFSAWGRQLAQQKSLIRGMVATYQPDYLLVLLGFNDIGWFISDAEGTFESMETFIGEARAAKPDVKFALSNIPQRTFIGGRDDLPIKTDVYNQILAGAIPWLSMYSLMAFFSIPNIPLVLGIKGLYFPTHALRVAPPN
jgi:lysophospholipase L1-like esterase